MHCRTYFPKPFLSHGFEKLVLDMGRLLLLCKPGVSMWQSFSLHSLDILFTAVWVCVEVVPYSAAASRSLFLLSDSLTHTCNGM